MILDSSSAGQSTGPSSAESTSFASRWRQAAGLLRERQAAAALPLLSELVQERPLAALWNDWANAQRLLGHDIAAEKGYLEALRLGPGPWQALLNLGCLWASRQRWREAAPVLEHAAAAQGGPAAPEPLRRLANLARQKSPPGKAPPSGLRILWIHDELPEADRSGAAERVAVLLAELQGQGHAVTYWARAGAGQERYLVQLAKLCSCIFYQDAARTRWCGEQPAAARLEGLLAREQFDLAVISHWYWNQLACSEQYLPLLRRLAPATRIVILSEDHHGLREERLAALSGQASDRERAADFSVRELDVYARADLVWGVSSVDRQGLLGRRPDLRIEILPPVVDLAPAGPAWAGREGVLFIGEYLNAANRDGLDWFLHAVWPQVLRRRPGLKLHLVGSHLPQHYARHPGVVAAGFAPSLAPVFARHRVAICPIRFGTGIKTKNLAALKFGLPFVTTGCGAEGMDLANGSAALITDDPAAFAAAVVELHEEPALWARLAAGGRAHAQRHFSPANLSASLRAALARVMAAPARPGWPLDAASPLWVEEQFPEVLTHQPAGERVALRVRRYLDLAQRELATGHADAARLQCGHAASLVPDPKAPLWGDIEAFFVRLAAPAGAIPFRRSRGRAGKHPEISVLIPTRNRRATLEKCLTALAAQTFAPDWFEVIVVDDGSTDDTPAFCATERWPFALRCFRQAPSGAGAARHRAASLARGERLLLINDDTIAAPDLLAAHARAAARRDAQRLAVLGDFRPPEAASRRALAYTIGTQPVLFPHPVLRPGAQLSYGGFVTCNLSLPRLAVLAAGNFDAAFPVAEDTELGARLEERGWGIVFEPSARAVHDHGRFTAADFVARARRYGPAQLWLHRKHPRLLGGGGGRLGRLDAAARQAMQAWMATHRQRIEDAVQSIAAYDDLDFRPFFERWCGAYTAADLVVSQLAQALLPIHWYYVYESLLAAWDQESSAASGPAPRALAPERAGATA